MTKIPLLIFGLTPELKTNLGISGSDSRFLNILKNIPKKDVSVTLVGTNDWANKLTSNKIDFNYIPIKSSIKGRHKITISLIAFINILKTISAVKLKKDYVIYSTSDLFWETIPGFFYRPKVKSWIQVIHHVYPKWYLRPGNLIINFLGFYLQKLSLSLIKKRADLIIVINPNVKEQLIKMGIPNKKIFLSSNAINYIDYHQSKNKKYEAVFLGRIDPTKGLNDFVPIWKNVCKTFPKAKLVLIGGTSQKNFNQLDKSILKASLQKNIKVLGYIDDSKKTEILSSSKIFIFPSHEEGWGIAIAEAMSFGLPVICWGLENLKQVFKNHLIYIEQFNYSNFSNEIIDLLKNPDKIKTLGLSNKTFVKHFSWKKISQKELEIIKKTYAEKK